MLDSQKERLDISCSLNLASCRLRAEALARQLHNKLWPIARFDLPDRSLYCGSTCLQSYASNYRGSDEPIIDKPPQSKRQYGANNLNSHSCWNSETGMFSSDDDEGYEPGDCSSPPSPADEEIVLNPPIAMPPVPSSIETSPPLEDMVESPQDYEGACANMTSQKNMDNCKIAEKDLNYGRMLCEKLQKYADSWTDLCAENNIANHVDITPEKPPEKEKNHRFEVVAVVSSCQVGDGVVVPPLEGRFTVTPCEQTTESVRPESNALVSEEAPPKRHGKGQLYLNVEVEEVRRPLIRSTSLKTGKTPPGTPRTKKIVRFADVLGLDLEAVKHIVSDDVPIIPQSAFTDLKISTSEPSQAVSTRTWIATPSQNVTHAPSYSLYPQFQQPVTSPDFSKRIQEQKVCLENIMVDDMTVHCIVRVSNVAYEKMVYARYTTTEWATCEDVLASYVPGSTDSGSDKFSFNIYVPHLAPGQRLCFALRYVAGGQEFWDNNKTCNYVLRCCSNSQILPVSQEGSRWLHHFM